MTAPLALLAWAWLLAAPPATPAAPPAPAPSLRCTCTYADEPVVVDVTPTAEPYRVEAVPVGARFAFKAVWVTEPADRAGLNLYAYHRTKTGDVLLGEVKLRPPYPIVPPQADGVASDVPYGFTGLHLVYEPDLHRELRFWCEWVRP